jgi:hypothetical protein
MSGRPQALNLIDSMLAVDAQNEKHHNADFFFM